MLWTFIKPLHLDIRNCYWSLRIRSSNRVVWIYTDDKISIEPNKKARVIKKSEVLRLVRYVWRFFADYHVFAKIILGMGISIVHFLFLFEKSLINGRVRRVGLWNFVIFSEVQNAERIRNFQYGFGLLYGAEFIWRCASISF